MSAREIRHPQINVIEHWQSPTHPAFFVVGFYYYGGQIGAF